MIRIQIILWLLLLSVPNIQAQDNTFPEIRELETLLRNNELESVLEQTQLLMQEADEPALQISLKLIMAKTLIDRRALDSALVILIEVENKLRIPQDDLLLADVYNIRGAIAFDRRDLSKAGDFYEKALGIRETYLGPEDEKVADAYNNLGNVAYLQENFQQAILYHEQARSIREALYQPPHPDLASSLNNLAACYYGLGFYEQALSYNEQALEQRDALFGEAHPLVAASYNNLGNCYFELNDFSRAIAFHEQALQIRQTLNLPEQIADSHNNLGNCYAAIGDYPAAVPYFATALNLYRQIFPEDNLEVAEVAANQGSALLEIGDYQNALDRLELAAFIYENQLGGSTPGLASILINQGLALSALNRYPLAEELFLRASKLVIASFGRSHPLLVNVYNNLGSNAFAQGNFKEAETYYLKSNWQLNEASTSDAFAQVQCFLNLGNCAREQALYIKADQWFQKATKILLEEELPPFLHLRLIIQRAENLKAQQRFSEAAELLEKTLQQYELGELPVHPLSIDFFMLLGETFSTIDPGNALNYYNQAASQLEVLLPSFSGRSAKQQLLQQYYPLYESGIRLAYDLWTEKQEYRYLENAFRFSEQSKATLLRFNLNIAQAKIDAQLPDSLLTLENTLQAQLGELEKIRFEQAHLLDSLTRLELNIEITRLKSAYAELIRSLEVNFPKYYGTKYQDFNISLATVQEAIESREKALVSYFMGDSSLFAFIIEREEVQLMELTKGDLETRVLQLWDGISNFTGAQMATDYENYARIYARNGAQIYGQILKPLIETEELPKELVVIPDGVLCYLPFELLLNGTVDSAQLYKFHRYPYLIHQYQFSYSYSVDLWLQLQSEVSREAPRNFAAFAPAFDGRDARLSTLRYNIQEVKNLAKLVQGGHLFIEDDATLDALKSNVGDYKTLHFATHGEANAQRSDFAYLAFAPADSSEVFLYTRDIYNLDLNATKMVVLSACETGLGEVIPGEGIISLAHAFTYSGAKSIITTLWSIDDQKTSELMQTFYEYLKKGYQKDAALQQAKIDFLSTYNGEDAHPFFWAAFIPLGNMEQLDLQSRWPLQKILLFSLGIVFFLTIGFMYQRTWAKI